MNMAIRSKKLGRTVSFSRPGRGYIFVDLSEDQSRPGSLGDQICYGGELVGTTEAYDGDDINRFRAICRNWIRQYYQIWVG